MKVFIIFLGLLLINVTFLTYQGDLSHYMKLRGFLKAVAEECACGAAMYYDEERYSTGELVIDREEAEKYTAYITEKAETLLDGQSKGELRYEIETAGTPEEPPAVTVTVTLVTVQDLFRLPFLTAKQVARAAKYELAVPGVE